MKIVYLLILPFIFIACNDAYKVEAAQNACDLIEKYNEYKKSSDKKNSSSEVLIYQNQMSSRMDDAGFSEYEDLDAYMKDLCDFDSKELIKVLNEIEKNGLPVD